MDTVIQGHIVAEQRESNQQAAVRGKKRSERIKTSRYESLPPLFPRVCVGPEIYEAEKEGGTRRAETQSEGEGERERRWTERIAKSATDRKPESWWGIRTAVFKSPFGSMESVVSLMKNRDCLKQSGGPLGATRSFTGLRLK